MSPVDPDTWRGDSREHWDTAAAGWSKAADRLAHWTAGLSATMVEALSLQPGQRVLELAAGPGDTGFMAAELIRPGGMLICSDGSERMLEVARERAAAQGIDNVEFKPIDLEWIDLPTADVDAVLCRWGLMLVVDREAGAREIRRVLRPGGRTAIAVWDLAERNPWATIPRRVMQERAGAPVADPDAPNQFTLAAPGDLAELLEGAGLTDVEVTEVAMPRTYADAADYLAATFEMATAVGAFYRDLDTDTRAAVDIGIAAELAPFTESDGTITVPASSLVAAAGA